MRLINSLNRWSKECFRHFQGEMRRHRSSFRNLTKSLRTCKSRTMRAKGNPDQSPLQGFQQRSKGNLKRRMGDLVQRKLTWLLLVAAIFPRAARIRMVLIINKLKMQSMIGSKRLRSKLIRWKTTYTNGHTRVMSLP